MEEYERKWYIETKSGGSMKRRQNTIPRVKKLRAKYRKEHGDQWWADPDVKEEYIEEKKALSRKSSGTSASSSKKSKSTKKKSKSKPYESFSANIISALPKKVSDAFFKIVDKLEELPDSYFNDGLYYDHVFITDGVALHIDTKHGDTKTRDLLQVLFLNYNTIQILAVKSGVTKKYKLSSTTPAFNYIKKWIESNL